MAIDTNNLFAGFNARVGKQLGIKVAEFEQLAALGAVTELFEARAIIYAQGETCRDMFVVSDGWLIGSSSVRDGGRFVHRIYQTGDIIGAEDINWNYGTTTVETVTPCILGRFPKSNLINLFQNSPTLAAAFHGITMNDVVVSVDTARANLRLGAADRVAHFLLQIQARQALVSADANDGVTVPLTQTQIADALGLTNVSVSRAISELAEGGLIEREGSRYRILQYSKLEYRSNFVNRYIIEEHEWKSALRSGLGSLSGNAVERDVPAAKQNAR